MSFLRAIVDRLVLVALIVAAGAAPSFIHQYRQQVGGRLAQVQADLAPFEAIARRRHGGDLDGLIAHHLASRDETFFREGRAIADMAGRADALAASFAALDAPLPAQAWYLLRHAEPDIARATFALFEPAFALDTSSIVFALVVGSAAWLLLWACWRLAAALAFSLRRSRNAVR